MSWLKFIDGDLRMKKEWWELLDWSLMRNTFPRMCEKDRKLILEKGYWSKGKGQFKGYFKE